jgi:hypothetical protein
VGGGEVRPSLGGGPPSIPSALAFSPPPFEARVGARALSPSLWPKSQEGQNTCWSSSKVPILSLSPLFFCLSARKNIDVLLNLKKNCLGAETVFVLNSESLLVFEDSLPPPSLNRSADIIATVYPGSFVFPFHQLSYLDSDAWVVDGQGGGDAWVGEEGGGGDASGGERGAGGVQVEPLYLGGFMGWEEGEGDLTQGQRRQEDEDVREEGDGEGAGGGGGGGAEFGRREGNTEAQARGSAAVGH